MIVQLPHQSKTTNTITARSRKVKIKEKGQGRRKGGIRRSVKIIS